MRRVVPACVAILLFTSWASAQPVLTLPNGNTIIDAGGVASVSISGGSPGHSFAIIGSSTESGFSFAGTALAVGTDVQIFGIGVLDGSGNGGPIPVPVPFPARDRYYIQGVTSPTPAFSTLTVTPGVVLINAQHARIYLAVGGNVNANGTTGVLSEGVTVTRDSPGVYTVSYPFLYRGVDIIPSITPRCGLTPTTMTANTGIGGGGFTVTFGADCGFFFSGTPIRR